MNKLKKITLFCLLGCLFACGGTSSEADYRVEVPDIESAKASLTSDMPLGTAIPINYKHPDETWTLDYEFWDRPELQATVLQHFNQVTSENMMKPKYLQPEEGVFYWDDADPLVEWAVENDISVHGHTLSFYNQELRWLGEYEGDTDAWIALQANHITTVVEHFKAIGNVVSWDVVNEGILGLESGEIIYRDCDWLTNIGEDYIERAFILANEADPDAALYYNDYSLLYNDNKLDGVLKMVEEFQANSVPIHGIGFQLHTALDLYGASLTDIREAFSRAVKTGLKVKISEMDVMINSAGSYYGLTVGQSEQQKEVFYDIVQIYLEEVPLEQRGGISVWGVSDADSYANIGGENNVTEPGTKGFQSPLLFNSDLEAKPALAGLTEAIIAFQ